MIDNYQTAQICIVCVCVFVRVCYVYSIFKQVLNATAEMLDKYPTAQIWVAGHSLGGVCVCVCVDVSVCIIYVCIHMCVSVFVCVCVYQVVCKKIKYND
jgi:putative lipase involved disintegration of autophagic bodies